MIQFEICRLFLSHSHKGKKHDDAVYYYLEGEPLHPPSSSDFAIVMIDEIWLRKKTKKIQTTRKDGLFFIPLKRIGKLKLVHHIVEFREEGCQSL